MVMTSKEYRSISKHRWSNVETILWVLICMIYRCFALFCKVVRCTSFSLYTSLSIAALIMVVSTISWPKNGNFDNKHLLHVQLWRWKDRFFTHVASKQLQWMRSLHTSHTSLCWFHRIVFSHFVQVVVYTRFELFGLLPQCFCDEGYSGPGWGSTSPHIKILKVAEAFE